jgi:hypothetical protein
MTGIDLKFDQDTMSAIVTKAILDGLGQDQRDLLIQQAVTALVTPARGGMYSSTPKTPIQEAFESAATQVCHRVAAEILTQDAAFLERVRELTREAISTAMAADSSAAEDLRRKILSAIAEAGAQHW